MSNKNFVVHNGLTVGPLTIDAATGDITTSGNVISTSSGSTNTVAVSKYLMQLPTNLVSATWYKLGTFSATSVSGDGETIEIITSGGQGYSAGSMAKDYIQVRILNGASPNVQAIYYSVGGYKSAFSGVKVKSVNGSATDKVWDIYAEINPDAGAGVMVINHNANSSLFQWVMTSTSDPGTASSTLVVADNKLVTATSNVVVQSGNLYVSGNIYQGGTLVATATAASGVLTSTFTGTGSQTTFLLSQNPTDISQMAVFWDGIYQPQSTYSLANGNQVTLTEAPPSGSTVEIKLFTGTGALGLSQLSDINFTNQPTDGQFLQYNASSGKWLPGTSTAAATVASTAITYAIALGGL